LTGATVNKNSHTLLSYLLKHFTYPFLIFSLIFGTCLLVPLLSQNFDDSLPLGKSVGEWKVADWYNSRPLKLKDLRGKVVLVRWWTGPHCPFCIASSGSLNQFHAEFEEEGLQVVAFYHHKSREPLNKEKVALNIESLGFDFPVAIDHEWRTLNDWWLKGGLRRFTSVTFLLDKKGVIRHIHSGGQYTKGDESYKKMKEIIRKLLAEKV